MDGQKKDAIDSITRSLIEEYDYQSKRKRKKEEIADTVQSNYCSISIHSKKYSNYVRYDKLLCRRIYSIGDNFHPLEKSNKEWNSFSRGIINLSLTDLFSNFIKLERIININTILPVLVALSEGKTELKLCPVCNHEITKLNDKGAIGEYECRNCKRVITSTFCNHCSGDSTNKKAVFWIKYKNPDDIKRNIDKLKEERNKVLEKQTGVDELVIDELSIMESMMGGPSITSLVYTDGLKSVCPYCGNILGHADDDNS